MEPKDVIEILKNRFKDEILKINEDVPRQIILTVEKNILTSLVDYLFNNMKARYITSVGGDERHFSLNYSVVHVLSLDKDKIFVLIRVNLPSSDLNIPSITNIISGANWAEREIRDLVGVLPQEHPDPRRLAVPDDWPDGVYPLRKDFPFDFKPPQDKSQKFKFKEPPDGAKVFPIGPFFPVLEEPAYFRVFIDGETVVDCDYRGFYNHRGIEKLGDNSLTYQEIPFIAERICGICGFIHSTCYVEAVESAGKIEVPERAKYIRSFMLELERVHSHLLWLGIAGHIIGFDTVLHQTWRIREPVMWLSEQISGNRKTYGMNLVGGVRRDIPKSMYPEIRQVLEKVKKETEEVLSAISGDASLHARLKGVGILTEEVARNLCVVGPTARGSGIAIDARYDHPYSAYDRLDFEVCVENGCDNWARTIVRIREIFESIKMINQILDEMPDGEILADVKDIEPLQEAVCTVEAPRGEAIHYVLTGDGNRPSRWKVRAPTYQQLQVLPYMIKGEQVADVPIILGSMDPCFSCTERMEVVDINTGKGEILSREELYKKFRK